VERKVNFIREVWDCMNYIVLHSVSSVVFLANVRRAYDMVLEWNF